MKILYQAASILACLLSASVFAAPKQLNNYAQLLDALAKGDNVKAVIHFDKCKMKKNGLNTHFHETAASTSINFNVFSHYKVLTDDEMKYTIATSNTILTEHSLFGPVYAYGRLRIFEDNSAEFHAAYYDPRTYEARAMVNYTCSIGESVDQESIALYDTSP